MDFLGKRISLFFLLALGFVFSLSGCKSYDARMMFGTGGTAGTYYAYGGVLAQYMRNFANVKVTAVSTGGSKVNVQSIQDGDYQLGFAQSDVMTYAWNGTRAFEKDGATHDFRVLGSLYDETVQLFTMNKDIKTVQDLKGKKVSINTSGSGVYFNAIDVLTAAGLTLDDIKPQFQSFGDSKEALKDGRIDAAFIVAGAPTSAITELATTNGVYLINIEGDVRAQIMEKCPYYTTKELAANTYPGQTEPMQTIAVKAVLIVSANANEETVYKLTSALFDHREEITKENAKGKELSIENATCTKSVPYHKGSAKYYQEHGVNVETLD